MPEKSPLLIIKTGSAPARLRERFGDFDDWFRRGFGTENFRSEVISVDQGHGLPDPAETRRFSGIVVTGSPAMVSERLDWSERCAAWLAAVHHARRPILGVCYGHQLLAHALGGRVGPNPHGRRIGTFPLHSAVDDDAILGPADSGLPVHSTHVEAVLEPPPGARVIATAPGDPCHALHFGHRSWGVQFHPEFDADIMRGYIVERGAELQAEGQDSAALHAGVVPAELGQTVLTRFAQHCQHRGRLDHVVSA